MTKRDRYWGELIRFVCPGLYGASVHDENGEFIPYLIAVPKFSEISAGDLVDDQERCEVQDKSS